MFQKFAIFIVYIPTLLTHSFSTFFVYIWPAVLYSGETISALDEKEQKCLTLCGNVNLHWQYCVVVEIS